MAEEEIKFESEWNSNQQITLRINESFSACIILMQNHHWHRASELIENLYDDLYYYIDEKEDESISALLEDLNRIKTALKKPKKYDIDNLNAELKNKTRQAYRALRCVQEDHKLGVTNRAGSAGAAI